ncbi:MAG: hypothetical protein JSV78_12385 [Phycisphaerales bacterium]|nr:MAG: hypothetical protein JSV78_12385 [Phycisphaerales bacterium]
MDRASVFQGDQGRTPAMESSGFAWVPVEVHYNRSVDSTSRTLAKATPENVTLLRWAARPDNQPPQSWWHDTSDPFQTSNE